MVGGLTRSIPKPLRGLFLRERRLLGILPRSAFEAVKRCFRVVLSRKEGVPGMVAALQTFGGQVQWNPHVHSLVSDGIFLEGGQFIPLPLWSEEFEELLTETYRRLVLDELVKAERLSSDFRERLLAFRHGGGFSVYGRHLILNTEPARLAHMARYAVRPPVSADRVHETEDGRVLLEIPPDPRTGDTVLVFDPLEWLRRLTNQIPNPGSHLVRYYGAYANRCRSRYRDGDGGVSVRPIRDEDEERVPPSRASWARLLRMVFEVDPLTCPQCGAEMKVISVITAPALIDKLLRHVRQPKAGASAGEGDSYDPRAPPAA